MGEGELTYGSYLRVPELLSLQQPRSRPPHPEELHFIIVHQALELWMKLMLHDLERVIGLLDQDAFAGALALLGRLNRTLEHALDQMRSLHTLPPWALQQFRSYLGTASGSQSVQFRELELLSGLREPAYLKVLEVEYRGRLPGPMAARLAQRSLADAHQAAAARLGIVDPAAWAELYVDPGRNPDFYLVCEALVDYDERWTRWRQEHVALVQRAIGDHARGTGGMVLSYLQRTVRYRFFPVLWALRDELVVRGGGELVGGSRHWSAGAPPGQGDQAGGTQGRWGRGEGVEYRRLLGSWLTYGLGVEADVAKACVARAYELGVNFFDTADVYGRGAAERVLGEALAGYDRSSYVLATKVYFPVGDGPNDRGLSRKHVMEQCHASLRRLRTDYVDLYQCHRFDDETPLDETLRALDDLVRQGKVLYVGVSEWTAGQIAEALRLADDLGLDRIVSNQPEYSILQRRIEAEVLPLCAREGVGQVVWSPLAQGVLTGKYRKGERPPPDSRAASRQMGAFLGRWLTDEVLDAVDRLRVVAEEAGVSLAQLALAWVLREPNVASAIVGATRPAQLEENCAAAGRRLDAEVLAAVDKAVAGVLEP